MKEAQQRVAGLKKRLKEKYGPEDAYALLTDLAEEVGEIAKAVKAQQRVVGKDKEKEKINLELADAIYSICALANHC